MEYLRQNGVKFQSTPPARGATQVYTGLSLFSLGFQSTPPARGATYRAITAEYDPIISIHAPREGGDDI